MATIKSYTDLQQAKKLAEILPLESADMAYYFMRDDGTLVNPAPFVLDGTEVREDGMFTYLNCWSLTALLGVLPEYNLQRTDWGNKTEYKIVVTVNEDSYASNNYTNPLDACYELILKFHELNLL